MAHGLGQGERLSLAHGVAHKAGNKTQGETKAEWAAGGSNGCVHGELSF